MLVCSSGGYKPARHAGGKMARQDRSSLGTRLASIYCWRSWCHRQCRKNPKTKQKTSYPLGREIYQRDCPVILYSSGADLFLDILPKILNEGIISDRS